MKHFPSFLLFSFLFLLTPFNKVTAQKSERIQVLIKPTIKKYTVECSIEFSPMNWSQEKTNEKLTSYYSLKSNSESINSTTNNYSEFGVPYELTGCQELIGELTKFVFRQLAQ